MHLGLGAFHRAHQALYTERLVAAGDQRWGILGISLRDPSVVNTPPSIWMQAWRADWSRTSVCP